MNLFIAFTSLPLPVALTFLFFLLLLLLPFLPGIKELVRPKDSLPLFIKMDHFKDPRYFDRSFKKIINEALEKTGIEAGTKQVKLSKNETVEISDSKTIPDGENINYVIYARRNFTSGKNVRLNKEVFAVESVNIGEKNILRAVACDGDITISDGTKATRWIGCEGNIKVGSGCSLGIICSCGGKMELSKECLFKALYGNPVITYGNGTLPAGKNLEAETSTKENPAAQGRKEVKTIEDTAWYSSESHLMLSPFTRIDKDIIVKQNLTLKRGCTVKGSLKSYGKIMMEEGVIIEGNVFAEGEIRIGEKCTITGNVFSQDRILFGDNVRIGKEGAVKSVIGKKGIALNRNEVIFGYILTEGVGSVSL